jgi:signal transduction histidine kinase
MTEGGEIVVAVQVTGGNAVEIHLTDNGPGVSPDISKRIFDPFVTTKARGNGFGLPLALRAAETNGGSLRLLEPSEGSGAHFVLEIPTHDPGADT